MKRRRKESGWLMIILACFCVYQIYHAVQILGGGDLEYSKQLITRIGMQITRQAVSIYMPGILYTEQEIDQREVLEDESTCESILEMNGRTLAERLLGENQEQAVKEENQEAIEKKEETVAAVTPQFDISLERLRDFDYLLNHFFVVDPNTTIDANGLNIDQLMQEDLTMKQDNSAPQILIYHTHSQELYQDSDPEDLTTGVIGVGDYLKQILEETYGYQVIHNTQYFDIVNGTIDRSRAYNQARDGVEQILAEYPTIEVIIDLHRDGVSEDTRLVTEINGKQTAQIMYFNGLSYTKERGALEYLPNGNQNSNLAFSFRMEYVAASYYPQLTRCVYLKGYRYNLDLRPKSMLLEVGAQTNTLEEAKNAMEPFAFLLNKVLKEE